MIEEFEKHGAPMEILTKAKPHIGTDRLREVVKNIREEIIALGGEVKFLSEVEDITVKGGNVVSVKVNGGEIPAENVILAVGHSARDTFAMLDEKSIFILAGYFKIISKI